MARAQSVEATMFSAYWERALERAGLGSKRIGWSKAET
jgi:hypothetical protein